MTRVSVAIPAYNSAPYIRDTIESVLAQDYADYELVVCDDGSSDETEAICRSFMSRGPMQYLRFAGPSGQAANWNRCIAETRGEYLVILHGDDVLAKTFLRRAAEMMDRYPEAVLAHCAVEHIDAEGHPLSVQRLHDRDVVEPGDSLFRRLLLDGCVVNPSGVMVRRAAYARAGTFTTDVLWGIDWHMWLRLSLVGAAAYLAETLASYRQHTASGTSKVLLTARNGVDEAWVIDDVFGRLVHDRPDLLPLRRRAVQRLAHRTWCWAESMCQHGQMTATRAGLRRSVSIWPPMLLVPRTWVLWAASYLGYEWFIRVVGWRRRVSVL